MRGVNPKRGGFSLVEIMIVIAVIGILAAFAFPDYQSQALRTKDTTAKNLLYVLRQAIERYAADHKGVPPGYPSNDPTRAPTADLFVEQLIASGAYLNEMPANPFNSRRKIFAVQNNQSFPANAVEGVGWIYKAQTKTIKLSIIGTDSDGVPYRDY